MRKSIRNQRISLPASDVSSHSRPWNRLFGIVPHQRSRSVELDFVRGIAILLVVKFHSETVPSANPVFRFLDYAGARIGDWGVDLFFVLSGFLVGGLLMKEYKRTQALDAKRFIFRRGLKIWPAYYVFLFLEAVTHAHPLRTFLWQNALHVQNYTGSTILHSWSLAVEEHFYLILALGMAWIVTRHWTPQRMLKVFIAVMALVFVVRSISFVWFPGPRTWEETHNRLDSLLCGVTLALLFHFFPEKFAALSRHRYLLGAIVILGLAYKWNLDGSLLYGTLGYSIAYVAAAALLLLVYSHSAAIRDTLLYRAVARIGV